MGRIDVSAAELARLASRIRAVVLSPSVLLSTTLSRARSTNNHQSWNRLRITILLDPHLSARLASAEPTLPAHSVYLSAVSAIAAVDKELTASISAVDTNLTKS